MTVLAAFEWPTNAELIADCAELGYLRPEWTTLDPTYGRGTWWKVWQPAWLIGHIYDKDHVDFRDLPYAEGTFDAAVFDPPYVAVGGRTSSTISDFNDRYGLRDVPKDAKGTQQLINDGLTEVARVVKPKGVVLVKCKDYVTSGHVWIGTHHTLTHGLAIGLELVDRFEHVGHPGPQPVRTRADGAPSVQQHARRNLSTLFVFRKVPT